MRHDKISLDGRSRKIFGDQRLVWVQVHHYPSEAFDSVIEEFFTSYGTVKLVKRHHWVALPDVQTGTRLVGILLDKQVARNVIIGGLIVRLGTGGNRLLVIYAGKRAMFCQIVPFVENVVVVRSRLILRGTVPVPRGRLLRAPPPPLGLLTPLLLRLPPRWSQRIYVIISSMSLTVSLSLLMLFPQLPLL